MTLDLTVVVPVFNELPNLRPLWEEIQAALLPENLTYEVLFVDDGSTDGSVALLQTLANEDSRVVVIPFRRNFGQTAGFAAGFDAARGDVVITMDADRQNDPKDMPALYNKLQEGYDVVNGWRQNRQDTLTRTIPSRLANGLIAWSTDVRLKDRGCSLRAFRREVVGELHLYGEMHRFIPELVSDAGFSMAEVPVNHRPRVAGESKYGLSRTFRVVLDLMTVLFLRRYGDRPMHLFGSLGLVTGALGGFLGLYLSGSKIWAGLTEGLAGFHAYKIGGRPLLQLAVLLIILGVLFLAMGLLAELLVRTYYESQNKTVYKIRV